MVEEKPDLRSAPEERGAPTSDGDKRILAGIVRPETLAGLMRPLDRKLREGWMAVAQETANLGLYRKLLDIREAAGEVRRGDYTEAAGRLIKRGTLDVAQALGVGLFWLAADRIYSEKGVKFLRKIEFPGQVCDLVAGLVQVLEKSGRKQQVIAGSILMKVLKDSGRHPQEGRMSDTELYLRYGRQRVLAFFRQVTPASFRRRN